ncbi:hypothetical protein DM02DRAFT_261879 [Periconia macrospinosa]|uniref:Uncharacterized protein n=1 Tax=Periconia macrospinosa TaxID=97972 RepID=A0A2V1DZ07_9PLEO|nr:hypothetical protein DM02DRAFT_261879 [Periconia macrospinosa]
MFIQSVIAHQCQMPALSFSSKKNNLSSAPPKKEYTCVLLDYSWPDVRKHTVYYSMLYRYLFYILTDFSDHPTLPPCVLFLAALSLFLGVYVRVLGFARIPNSLRCVLRDLGGVKHMG